MSNLPKACDYETSQESMDARQAVWDAHPIEDDAREAYAAEVWHIAADPLKEVEAEISSREFKPDAPWGLVVYRVAYGDDAAWERMLGLLDEAVEPDELDLVNKHLF